MTTTAAPTGRRTLHFSSMADLAADVRSLGSNPGSSGNWSAAENLQHVTKIIERSMDGFDNIRAPLLFRLTAPLMKSRILAKPFSPGFKLRGSLTAFEPDPGVTWEQATAQFQRAMDRIEGGDTMTQRSPVLGEMTHDDWVRLHCRHAELHFSFLHPDE